MVPEKEPGLREIPGPPAPGTPPPALVPARGSGTRSSRGLLPRPSSRARAGCSIQVMACSGRGRPAPDGASQPSLPGCTRERQAQRPHSASRFGSPGLKKKKKKSLLNTLMLHPDGGLGKQGGGVPKPAQLTSEVVTSTGLGSKKLEENCAKTSWCLRQPSPQNQAPSSSPRHARR
uniref:Uncharacterized protein n=1 Tax=Pipistrellus kuhlii TaxID=59472 RepID=A0A7J7VUS3_PIPKU|nr:hypothetical protein mPipKuh1_008246 [Pipistrellus kuhlii]